MFRVGANRKRLKSNDGNSATAGLLISIMLRYPEISSIDFDSRRRTIRFRFIVTKSLRDSEFQSLKALLLSSLETLKVIQNAQFDSFDVSHTEYMNISIIEMARDVNTLTQDEISLLVSIFCQEFGSLLVRDEPSDYLFDEQLVFQDEVIGKMLEDLRTQTQRTNLVAIREDGRVFVFND